MKTFEDFEFYHLDSYIQEALDDEPVKLAVAGAEDANVLETAVISQRADLVEGMLFGDEKKITEMLNEMGSSAEDFNICHCSDSSSAALEAALAAGRGDAQMLMKGFVSSADFLRAVLNEDANLRTGRILSHLGVFDIPSHDRLLGMTDGGINISPDLQTRMEIVKNAAEAGGKIFSRQPKIALLAAVEKVQDNMPITLDWATISKMADRGQIKGAVVDGPLALDNAIDPRAMKEKGIDSPIEGRADILVVPDIEAGNLLGKALTYMADAPMAGLVLGARVPVILNSRADSAKARFSSLIMAHLMAE